MDLFVKCTYGVLELFPINPETPGGGGGAGGGSF